MLGDDLVPYLPEHIKPYADQLKQFPENFEKWVYATAIPENSYQGDVAETISLVSIDADGTAIRAETPGMVVSNTCDTQPGQGDFVLVAPVLDLEDYRKESELRNQALENHLRDLKQNKISQLMFLPKGHGISDCFVDFGNICSVSLQHFHSRANQTRLQSLSQCGHYFMLVKLAYHFTRPEPGDAKRK
jgi:hypothetical protein